MIAGVMAQAREASILLVCLALCIAERRGHSRGVDDGLQDVAAHVLQPSIAILAQDRRGEHRHLPSGQGCSEVRQQRRRGRLTPPDERRTHCRRVSSCSAGASIGGTSPVILRWPLGAWPRVSSWAHLRSRWEERGLARPRLRWAGMRRAQIGPSFIVAGYRSRQTLDVASRWLQMDDGRTARRRLRRGTLGSWGWLLDHGDHKPGRSDAQPNAPLDDGTSQAGA